MIKQANLIPDEGVIEAVMEVVKSGQYINGPYGQRFSIFWAGVCSASYCVPCSSGSAALISCLKFFKEEHYKRTPIQSELFAVIPSYSFAATLFSVLEAGYIPIFCGVDSRGLMIEEQLLKILRENTIHAIIPVHLYGQYLKLNVEQIRRVTEAAIIEDACQAHGIFELQGDAAAFSFYPSKNLGALGNAGAVVTNNEQLHQYVNRYINYGDDLGEKYAHHIQGNNLRMDEIQAAALLAKASELQRDIWERSLNVSHYMHAKIFSIAAPYDVNPIPNNYHLYPVLFDERDKAMQIFKQGGIEVGNHYPYTLDELHAKEKHYKYFPYWQQDVSKLFARHVLTLPIGPHLIPAELEEISIFIHENFKYVSNGISRGMFICR